MLQPRSVCNVRIMLVSLRKINGNVFVWAAVSVFINISYVSGSNVFKLWAILISHIAYISSTFSLSCVVSILIPTYRVIIVNMYNSPRALCRLPHRIGSSVSIASFFGLIVHPFLLFVSGSPPWLWLHYRIIATHRSPFSDSTFPWLEWHWPGWSVTGRARRIRGKRRIESLFNRLLRIRHWASLTRVNS